MTKECMIHCDYGRWGGGDQNISIYVTSFMDYPRKMVTLPLNASDFFSSFVMLAVRTEKLLGRPFCCW